MLRQVADGVRVHTSTFCQSNAVIVEGDAGVLLIDAGVLDEELADLARSLDRPVVAGFSTHPHWDHLLWHPLLGAAPRHATARCAAFVESRLSAPGAQARVTSMMPPDLVSRIPLDLLGDVTALPADATELPWDGPRIRILEHQAHAPGHASLLLEDSGVLIGGDMLSDALIPMLDLSGTADPVGDYLAALDLLSTTAASVVIPGHGSVGADVSARIAQDRAYVESVRDGVDPADPRLGPTAFGKDFLPGVHERQVQHLGGS
ncbi:MBL fold metallo-hydrolase [Amycolatopsis sp. NPDC004368]